MPVLKQAYHQGAHVSEDQLLPESACPICGYAGSRRPIVALQDAPPVHLAECRCGCISASRIPREEVLREYYTRYYTAIDGTATFDGSARFARHLFRCLGVAPKSNIRILDFGGGVDAVLSRSLAQQFIQRGTRNVEIALVDYNAACARDWGAITVDCYQNLADAAGGAGFDVVIASAIVEHIPDPRGIMLTLLNSLSVGGRAYFRTPAMSSIVKTAALFGMRIDFTYPAHVHDMGQRFWDNALAALDLGGGFKLVRSRPSIVETEFRIHPLRTVIAHAFKLPWHVLRRHYSMVGGWEAVFARI